MSKQKEFETLIERHKGIVIKVSNLYIDDFEEREDVRQEILLQAWKSYARFKGDSSFGTWLYRVALNTTLSWKKKQPEGHESIKAAVDTPHEDNHNDLKYKLLDAIKQLSEVDRAIISMHLDGYEHDSIAHVMGLTRNNVNVRLHRAKQQLSKLLQ